MVVTPQDIPKITQIFEVRRNIYCPTVKYSCEIIEPTGGCLQYIRPPAKLSKVLKLSFFSQISFSVSPQKGINLPFPITSIPRFSRKICFAGGLLMKPVLITGSGN